MIIPAISKGILTSDQWKPDNTFKKLTNEKVIGFNNLLRISWLKRGLEVSNSIARVITPEGLGTGFLIGQNLMMTNNHVIDSNAIAKKSQVEFNFEEAWHGGRLPVSRYRVLDLLKTDSDLDYSILLLEGDPGKKWGTISLDHTGITFPNDYVTIVQHPKGGCKQISLTDNKVSAVFDNKVQYTTDTEPGSSGSPVFNQEWELVALHHAGGMMEGPNGDRSFINEGISIVSIIEHAGKAIGKEEGLGGVCLNILRNSLVNLIKTKTPTELMISSGTNLMLEYPDFQLTLRNSVLRKTTNKEIAPLIAAAAGVAAGASIRYWARSSGHEAIEKAEVVDPGSISREIINVVSGYLSGESSEKSPYNYYQDVFKKLTTKDDISGENLKYKNSLSDICPTVQRPEMNEALPILAACFVAGVYAGAKAYDGGK